MNNVFMVGLQRTGTNYVETLFNNNVSCSCARGTMFDVATNCRLWKHDFPSDKIHDFPIVQNRIVAITKNPYMWVEGIVKGDDVRDMGTDEHESEIWSTKIKEKYGLFNDRNEVSLKGLCRLYKDFYEEWVNNELKLPFNLVKYEDFLTEKKAIDCVNSLNLTLKSNLKLPSKPVRWSPKFTIKQFEYGKKEVPEHLSLEQIKDINSILGKGFIAKLGYRVYKV